MSNIAKSLVAIPAEIDCALQDGAALIISVSGGKDSDAMTSLLVGLRRVCGWPGPVALVHADLGRAEWSVTRAYVECRADELGLPLRIIQRPQGDLLSEMQARFEKRPDVPPFPSAAARYCTADQKRAQIDKVLREYDGPVICAIGIRAQESPTRRRKPIWEPRRSIATNPVPNRVRLASSSSPDTGRGLGTLGVSMAELSDIRQQVRALREQGTRSYEAVAATGWRYHPAYALGNERLSCSICILGAMNDINNGIEHNPDYYRELVKLEQASGFTFRQNLRLADLRPDLLDEVK
jgi:3'-phosphoadenosine 5'-phosphosulfate sulfotransferase (PAPS reductase)/FAD synthetase